jgi:hypothetical protein
MDNFTVISRDGIFTTNANGRLILSDKFLLFATIDSFRIGEQVLELPLLDSYGLELLHLSQATSTHYPKKEDLSRLSKNADIVGYIRMAAYLQTKPEFIVGLSECLMKVDTDIKPVIENCSMISFNHHVGTDENLGVRVVDTIIFEKIPYKNIKVLLPYLNYDQVMMLIAEFRLEEDLADFNPSYSLHQLVSTCSHHRHCPLKYHPDFQKKIEDLTKRLDNDEFEVIYNETFSASTLELYLIDDCHRGYTEEDPGPLVYNSLRDPKTNHYPSSIPNWTKTAIDPPRFDFNMAEAKTKFIDLEILDFLNYIEEANPSIQELTAYFKKNHTRSKDYLRKIFYCARVIGDIKLYGLIGTSTTCW